MVSSFKLSKITYTVTYYNFWIYNCNGSHEIIDWIIFYYFLIIFYRKIYMEWYYPKLVIFYKKIYVEWSISLFGNLLFIEKVKGLKIMDFLIYWLAYAFAYKV